MTCEVRPSADLEQVEKVGETDTASENQPQEAALLSSWFVDYPDPDYDGF